MTKPATAPAAAGPAPAVPGASSAVPGTVMKILLALSLSHLLNDTIQSLIPAIYPLLKTSFRLSFTQIGLITLTFQVTASLLQPLVGTFTDRHPQPWSLAIGMGCTLVGLVLLSRAGSYPTILASAALVGTGSSVFHPEASRIAHLAAGRRRGFAQAIFQVGGNLGSSFGPLLAALIIVPRGQGSIVWFTGLALLGIVVLARVGGWYRRNLRRAGPAGGRVPAAGGAPLSRRRVVGSLAILVALVFSKYVYLVSLTNYYTFYLIRKFHVSVPHSQIALFVFLLAVAAGTILGGPLGDRFGRKYVIWFSILGVAPFSLVLPHVGLAATIGLSAVIGVILASAFSAILVYAQELVPGKVGMIAGLFFGLAFGISGIASAALGRLADRAGIEFVFLVCGFLPLLGMITALLPNLEKPVAQIQTESPR
jgi:FSR family fosmidomycin resistance protein-like MFS transporter